MMAADLGQRDKSQWMVWRPFYFANLIVDPKNPDRVFKTDGALILSEDGGKSFATVGGFDGAHGDVHAVWIDPTNPQTVISGDDGGIWYSYDGGNRWWKGENLPISQFYHVSVDDDDPYQVYGGLQDNSCWVGQSEYPGGITNHSGKTCSMAMASIPSSTRPIPITSTLNTRAATSVGSIATLSKARIIQPKPNYKEKLRFNWNTPLVAFA